MRAFLISAAAALALFLGAPAEPAAAALDGVASLQEAQPSGEGGGRVNVDVDVDRGDRPWYLSPFWIGVFVVALALIVILSLVSRSGSSGGGTTIVKT